ncbi:MAG: AMP-binding protein [Actinomycetota bacterium]
MTRVPLQRPFTSETLRGTTVGELVDAAAERFGDAAAYIDGDVEESYVDLAHRSDEVASGLLERGVRPGDRVALWLANGLDWIHTYYGALKAGCVVVPVNTSFTADEAAYVVAQSKSRVLVAGGRYKHGPAEDLVPALLSGEGVAPDLVLRTAGGGYGEPLADLVSQGRDADPQSLADARSAVAFADPAFMFYTSGTTGFPKGALHSHKVLLNMADASARMGITPGDRLVLFLPLFHVFGAFAGSLAFLTGGGTIILMPAFDGGLAVDLMARHRATITYGFPTTYYDQIRSPQFADADLSSVRLAVNAGPPESMRAVDAAFGNAVGAYGMTESTSMTTLGEVDDPPGQRLETIGHTLPGFECRVVDEAGQAVPDGQVGELLVRGHPVMHEYFEKPEETAAALSSDGWFRTGDAVVRRPDGYFAYQGRIKDMFKVGGENVDPAEVERVLSQHEAVGMVAVVGVPDERLGEVGMAYVEPLAGCSEEELIAFAKERMARFKVPKYVEFVDRLPRTASGKIQKFRLNRS